MKKKINFIYFAAITFIAFLLTSCASLTSQLLGYDVTQIATLEQKRYVDENGKYLSENTNVLYLKPSYSHTIINNTSDTLYIRAVDINDDDYCSPTYKVISSWSNVEILYPSSSISVNEIFNDFDPGCRYIEILNGNFEYKTKFNPLSDETNILINSIDKTNSNSFYKRIDIETLKNNKLPNNPSNYLEKFYIHGNVRYDIDKDCLLFRLDYGDEDIELDPNIYSDYMENYPILKKQYMYPSLMGKLIFEPASEGFKLVYVEKLLESDEVDYLEKKVLARKEHKEKLEKYDFYFNGYYERLDGLNPSKSDYLWQGCDGFVKNDPTLFEKDMYYGVGDVYHGIPLKEIGNGLFLFSTQSLWLEEASWSTYVCIKGDKNTTLRDLAKNFIVKYIGTYKYKNENNQILTLPQFELINPVGYVNPDALDY